MFLSRLPLGSCFVKKYPLVFIRWMNFVIMPLGSRFIFKYSLIFIHWMNFVIMPLGHALFSKIL